MDSDAAYAMPSSDGGSPAREIVVPANSPATLVIDGLQPSSMYEFQVPDRCGGGVVSGNIWKPCVYEGCEDK